MPSLACYVCGRTIWSAAPLEDLFSDERRCPRCGSTLLDERRQADRRVSVRRQGGAPHRHERRVADRRVAERRGRKI